MPTALQMHQVTMRFPACTALDGVNFTLEKGEIHALVGEPGAGTSALAHVLAGLYQPSDGTLSLYGAPFDPHQQHKHNVNHTVGLVHQKSILIPQLTVAQNVTLGAEPKKSHFFDKNASRSAALSLSQQYGLELDVDAKVEFVSPAMAIRVEIAKCLHRQAEILILDTPKLSSQELLELGSLLTNLTTMGKSILLISQHVGPLLAISHRITVLRKGQLVETLDCAQTTVDALSTSMVGHSLTLSRRPATYATQTPMVVFDQVYYKTALSALSFTLYQGEVLAIVGGADQGQSELVQLMAGFIQASKGKVMLDGINIAQFSPKELMDYGVSFISSLETPKKFDFSGLQNQLLGFRTPPIYQKGLSESQQDHAVQSAEKQKVASTKRVQQAHGAARLLVAHQPYTDMDSSAIARLHHVFHQACKDGKSVLLTAMELDKVLLVADRIAIIRNGTVTDVMDATCVTRAQLEDIINQSMPI